MKKLTKRFKKNEGFTLMEIIIVIVILGILALIAIPRLIGFTTQAEMAADKEYAAVVARAAELYWASHEKTVPADLIGTLETANMVANDTAKLQYYGSASVVVSAGGDATVTLTGGDSTNNLVYNSITGYSGGD